MGVLSYYTTYYDKFKSFMIGVYLIKSIIIAAQF